jgi:Tol biopolymer transport system component
VEIPLDGSTPRQLPSVDPRTQWDVTFSHDGSRVAYVDSGSLVVAAADGSDARTVMGPWVQNPVWSSSGDRIAFTYSESIDWPYATELRVFDVTTGTVTSLTGEGGSDQLIVIEFSPEGDRILFRGTSDRGRGESSLWSVRTDGSDLRRLVAGTSEGDWR